MDIDGKLYCSRCMRPLEEEGKCPHCGHDPREPGPRSALEEGTLLNGRYQLGAVIGQGGFGITYAAWDEILNVPVAIKEYYPADFASRDTRLSDDVQPAEGKQGYYLDGVKRFQRESHLLAELQGIPQVVKVLDFFSENNTAYIAMEYIHGVPVDQYVRDRGLKGQEVLTLMRPALDALVAAHRQGVLHRDLTVSNILIQEDGTIKLIDFGSAAEVQRGTGTVLLTRQFAPVEQYGSEHGAQGPWTDVYGISAVLYALLTGQAPQESVLRVYDDQLKAPRSIGVRIGRDRDRALMAGLCVNPENRTQSMDELRARLYRLPLPEQVLRQKRLARRIGIAAAVLLILGAVLAANFSVGLPLGKGLLFGLRQDGWHVIGHTAAAEAVEIPGSVLGIPVIRVGDGAFRGDQTIRTAVIPGSVREVGDMAFYGSALCAVTLEEGVERLGVGSFAQCGELTQARLPKSLTQSPEDAFSGAPENLLIWGNRGSWAEGFAQSRTLRFADGGEMVFEPNENGLTLTALDSPAKDLVIPDEVDGVPVTRIGPDVRITSAETLVLPAELMVVPEKLCQENGSLRSVRLGEKVETIGDWAFEYCRSLTEINFPASLTDIGKGVFRACALESLTLPEGVWGIGQSCFADCPQLTQVYLPDSLIDMGVNCFYRCRALREIRLPEGLMVLPDSVLYDTAVTRVHLPESLMEMGTYCFAYSPLEYLMIPENVQVIGSGCFYSCEKLRLLVVMNDWMTVTGDSFQHHLQEALIMLPWRCDPGLVIAGRPGSAAQTIADTNGFRFEDITLWSDYFTLEGDTAVFSPDTAGTARVPWYNTREDCPVRHTSGADGTRVASVRLPLMENKVGHSEFCLCQELEAVEFTGPLEEIGIQAFMHCVKLSQIELPDGLVRIGESAFRNCSSLETACLPDSLTDLEDYAFWGCTALRNVTLSRSLKVLLPRVFCETGVREVTIPSNIWQLNLLCFGDCPDLVSVTLEEGVRRVDSTAFEHCDSLETVVIPKSVYMIGGMAFTGSSLKDIWVYNPNMSFIPYIGQPSIAGSTPTIHAHTGSVAQRFAQMCDLPFEPLD